MTTPVPAADAMSSGAAELIIKDASFIHIFGYDINVFASIVIGLFVMILIGLWKAHDDDRVDWIDAITSVEQATGKIKVSVTKILQIVGGIVGTFVVVKMTMQNVMTWDIFAIYLTYVASIDGFSRFILAKYGVNLPPDTNLSAAKPKDE